VTDNTARNDRRTYCTLVISSSEKSVLPGNAFTKKFREVVEFRDIEERKRQKGVRAIAAHVDRYWWILNTNGKVDSDRLIDHVEHFLRFRKGTSTLGALWDLGYKIKLSVFWEGFGTGGGPTIDLDLIELLHKERLPIQVGFYVVTPDDAV
jgi:hypothetical protein